MMNNGPPLQGGPDDAIESCATVPGEGVLERNAGRQRSPYRKTDRASKPRVQPLAEPIEIAEWKKNRSGESIRVTLKSYERHNLVDVRTWYGEDGYRKPGKGFAASVRHLPALADAINAALTKARELGLLAPGAQS